MRGALSLLRSLRSSRGPQQPASRAYAGHGHGAHGVTHEGLTLYPAASWHKSVATGMSGLMWFWVLLRWKEDGETLIFGHAPHFAHEIAHEEEHLQYKPGAK